MSCKKGDPKTEVAGKSPTLGYQHMDRKKGCPGDAKVYLHEWFDRGTESYGVCYDQSVCVELES